MTVPAAVPPIPTVRDSVIDLMRRLGMTSVFANPGSTELPMFRDFPADFRYVLGLQEAVVVGMADGFAQASGRASLVNLHSAAGVGNAMGNIFTAFKNHTPIVITAGQQARSILPYDPFLGATQAAEMPKPYVKWSIEPARAQDVPLALARAYRIAMQEPRGPVFVSIPVDDWDQPAEYVAVTEVSTAVRPDPAALAGIGAALDACARPAFVVGAGVDHANAWDEVVQLAERHNARVFVAPMSARCSFPEDHRLFAGFLPAMRERIVELLDGHDLIFALGAPAFTYHVEGDGPHIPPGSELIQLIDDPSVAAWIPVGTSVVGNVRLGIDDLLARPEPVARPEPAPREAAQRVKPSSPLSVAFTSHDAAAFADHAARHLLHDGERRPRSRHAGRGRRGAGEAGATRDRRDRRRLGHVFHPGAVERCATWLADRLRDSQQRALRGTPGLRARVWLCAQRSSAGHGVARHRLRRACSRNGLQGSARC